MFSNIATVIRLGSTIFSTNKESIILSVGDNVSGKMLIQLNFNNSNTQGKQKNVRIVRCSIYQKFTLNTPGLLPVIRHKNGETIPK